MKKFIVIIIALAYLNIEATAQSGWFTQTSGTFRLQYSVHFEDTNTGWIPSSQGILKTTNGGDNWEVQSDPYMLDLYFVDADFGWAVGGYGKIIKTTNGGTNWIQQSSGIGDALRSIHFTDHNTGWTVGDPGIILKTTNGGNNWIPQTSGTNRWLLSVYFSDSNTGWASGLDGVILRTTNSGDNWIQSILWGQIGYPFLHSVHFVNNTTGWVVGSWGTIFKTTNGGIQWTLTSIGALEQSAPELQWRSVFFVDSNSGWVAGLIWDPNTSVINGVIRSTTNGGTSWEVQKEVTGEGLFSVYFANSNTGWVAGEYGSIFKTTTGGHSHTCLIHGPEHVTINSTPAIYWAERIFPGNFELVNYGTNAAILDIFGGDTIAVEVGNYPGYFDLNYRIDTAILCSKRVYVEEGLPVELNSFNSDNHGRNVYLTWSTAAELNNSGFEIERAIISAEWKVENVKWSNIGFVKGSGTTNETRLYSFIDRNLETGMYNYRLKQIDFNGNFEYFELPDVVSIGIPDKYDLSQNYPNPFNPVTTINYDLPSDGIVTIKVYDILGREVKTLVNEMKAAGYHRIQFSAADLASGAYFYQLVVSSSNQMQSGEFVAVKRFVVIK